MSGSLKEDISAMRAAGANIDDDNEPAVENIPDNGSHVASHNIFKQWGFSGICYWKRSGNIKRTASIPKSRELWRGLHQVNWFFQFFPITYVIDVMLPVMNDLLDAGRPDITW